MTPENTNEEIKALKNQIFTLLIALIVISGTLLVTLYRQTSMVVKDIAQGEQAENNMKQMNVNMNAFVSKLAAYSDKHPEFRPVLAKNGITPTSAAPAGSPIGALPVTPKK